MLCPRCGGNVGDKMKICDQCQRHEAQQRLHLDSQPSGAGRVSGTFRSGAGLADVAPALTASQPQSFFVFIRTPFGIACGALLAYLVLWLSVIMVAPGKGLIETALMTLVVTGLVFGTAAPYAFMFSKDDARRQVVRFGSYAIAGIGLGLLSLYTGKHPMQLYYEIDDLRHKDYRTEEEILRDYEAYGDSEASGYLTRE